MDEKHGDFREHDNAYCYPQTNVLINKLNITDYRTLCDVEGAIVSYEIASLSVVPIKGNFDFRHLKDIHFKLFGRIYDWAGKTRNCAIAKKDLFCLPQHIDGYANDIFSRLAKNDYYIDLGYEATILALVRLLADINALHPFREGNGRAQREFIKELGRINGIDFSLENINQTSMIIASHDSLNGNYQKLTELYLKNAVAIDTEEQIQMIESYIKAEKLQSQLIKALGKRLN